MSKLLNSLLGGLLSTALLVAPGLADARTGLPEFADLVELAGPAVVNIRTTAARSARSSRQGRVPIPEGMDENDPFFEFFRRFFPPGEGAPGERREAPESAPDRGRQLPRGVGSGFVFSPDGFVMTNHHVVDGADEIYVTFSDDREFKAKLIGSDKRTDVAVVKIDGTDLPSLVIGNPNKLRVGEWVLAIGSPFGLENTVTAGIVSAKGRDTGDYLPFIQTDAAVNPGNSGGPMINLAGEVVGVNTMIIGQSFRGVSFSIPSELANEQYQKIREKGFVERGFLGVSPEKPSSSIRKQLGLDLGEGVIVTRLQNNTPAAEAGLRNNDVILRWNDHQAFDPTVLSQEIAATEVGADARVLVRRLENGKPVDRELTVRVGRLARN